MRESENLQLILLSCVHFSHDLRRDHYLMLQILSGNKDHLRRTIVQYSALRPMRYEIRPCNSGHYLVGLEISKVTWQPPWATCSTVLLFSWWKDFSQIQFEPLLFQLVPAMPLCLLKTYVFIWVNENIMEIEEVKHLGPAMLLTIAPVGTMLIPKKEDLQGAGLSDSKCPSKTIMLYEWTLVTLPVQSRVSSKKSYKLHKNISPSLWRSLWLPHLLWLGFASIPLA